jgi:hypothetical protein
MDFADLANAAVSANLDIYSHKGLHFSMRSDTILLEFGRESFEWRAGLTIPIAALSVRMPSLPLAMRIKV